MRPVPVVPDLEDSPQARTESLAGDYRDREHSEGKDRELDDQGQARELEILSLEDARPLRGLGWRMRRLEFLR